MNNFAYDRVVHCQIDFGMMRNRIINTLVCVTGMVALSLLQGCDKGIEQGIEFGGVENSAKVKQVDMTVAVPIHPSSFEYFDYSISYTDNDGKEYLYTVSSASSDKDIYFWTMNFAYKLLPVSCRCEVTLVPKVPGDTVVSFSFVNPKPYIYSHVAYNPNSYGPLEWTGIEGLGVLRIDDMSIDSFLSAYGSTFISVCQVKESYDSIDCTFN